MFKKNENKNTIDINSLNSVISLSKRLLKLLYGLFIAVAIYLGLILIKELNITPTILVILKVLTPLFIGLFLAWLFDPFVKALKKKGIKRGYGTTIVYVVFIGILALIICSLIPILIEQINDFAKSLPSIFDSLRGAIDGVFDNLNEIDGFDAMSLKNDIFRKIEDIGLGLTQSLPEILVNVVKIFFSGIGTFGIGLIIGFYLLISFDNASDLIFTWLPKNIQNDARDLSNEVNTSLRKFITGAMLDCFVVFLASSIGFLAVGLKAPLLFGLFCGLTNIIPYVGPYIGGAPAVIVALSQGPITGIITLIIVVVVQMLEGNLLQPVIMSKTTKLHPVTIMIGLLLFGHFFGILGMAISTPVIAALKTIAIFFIEKYDLLSYNK